MMPALESHATKVLYITNSLPHYFNLVLSRLNLEDDIEVVVLAPSDRGKSVGEGVYQTKDGANFRIHELPEIKKFLFLSTYKKINEILYFERPDVIIVIEDYINALVFDPLTKLAIWRIGARLILKSIPFRYLCYSEAMQLARSGKAISSLPPAINSFLLKINLIGWVRYFLLQIKRQSLLAPEAHINYTNAPEYWSSYGVPDEKIFVTRNSPDTDEIFSVQKKIKSAQPILPVNQYRIIHVGRLVEWKRVDLLLHAFARFRKIYSLAELLVVGEGPELSSLRKLAFKLKLDSSVHFVGACYDPELLGRYYSSASLYVLAGMGGLSINEAMSYGLPILCSICDGTEKFLVRDGVNGTFFEDGSEDALLQKLRNLFEDLDKLRMMGRSSRQIIIDEININTVIQSYKDAINYVANKKISVAAL